MKKILVIQTAFPGDAILTLPLIQQISKKYGTKNIDVIAIPATEEIFRASGYVNKVIVFDKKKNHKGIIATLRFGLSLRLEKYDVLFSPHRSFRSGLISLLSGCADRRGFSNSSFRKAFNTIVEYRTDFHEVQRNLSLLDQESAGSFQNIFPAMNVSANQVESVNGFVAKIKPGKFVVIAPGSVWATKKYPEKYYIDISQYFLERGFSVVLAGSKSDSEVSSRISAGNADIYDVSGKFSIPESVELMRRCEMVICNDSAPAHMALTANARILMIYCSTDHSFGFYPYSSKSSYISYGDLPCKPCGIHGYNRCPIKTFDCGYKLIPQKVIERIEEMLAS